MLTAAVATLRRVFVLGVAVLASDAVMVTSNAAVAASSTACSLGHRQGSPRAQPCPAQAALCKSEATSVHTAGAAAAVATAATEVAAAAAVFRARRQPC